MNRLLVFVAIVTCAVVSLVGRTDAMTSICPAYASALNPLDAAAGSKMATTFSYELDALSPETVSGTLSVQTDAGWYQVPFGPTVLAAHKESYRLGQTVFTRNNIFSDVLYVRFPKPVSISDEFVSTITTDDVSFRWPTTIGMTCENAGGPILIARASPDRTHPDDVWPLHPALLAEPSTVAPLAASTRAFDALGCATPFKNATPVKQRLPDFPDDAKGIRAPVTVIVAVVVDATGKVSDDWVVAPSSIEPLNRASLLAAEASTFSPTISRCQPVVSAYLFHATFIPDQ